VTALIRTLRTRSGALAVTALAVTVAAGFSALATDAWAVALPRGIAADIADSPDDGVLVSATPSTLAAYATEEREVRTVVGRSAPAGTFTVNAVMESATFDLTRPPPPSTNTNTNPPPQTTAVSLPALAGSAALVQGSWPTDPAGPLVPVALPVSALRMAHLSIGQTFTLWNSSTGAPLRFQVTGSFRYLDPATAGGAWNTIGASGVEYDGPFTVLGPMVATAGAFRGGALPIGTGAWVVKPDLSRGTDIGRLRTAVAALIDASKPSYILSLSSAWGFSVQTRLPALLDRLPARITAGRAQLLAETLLLATLAAIAITVSCANLVARGEAQSALLRSRGSPCRILVTGYIGDMVILIAFSALGAGIEDLFGGSRWALASGSSPLAAWVAALAVGIASALVVLARAAIPPRAAEVAASAGRQLSAPAIVRAGLDGALVVVAAVTLWQAAHAGLTAGSTTGGSSAVFAVALAPAVVTLAGAAVCGRLVTVAAHVSERAAERIGSLPVRLAAWELGRTPLRYLVPALLCVAAVAGCAYAAGQDASQVRSAHDQAAFSVGADASLAMLNPLPLGQVGSLIHQPDVLAATPEITVGSGDGSLLGFDSHAAARTVALRADLAGGHPEADWAALSPSPEPGIPVPGKPVSLGLALAVDGAGLGPVSPILDIEDATGLSYQLSLGTLAPDGRVHIVSTGAVLGPRAAYPLRITGLSLSYTLPHVYSTIATVTVSSLSAQSSDHGALTAFPGASQLAKTWTATVSSTLEPYPDFPGCPVPPGSTVLDSMGADTDGEGPAVKDDPVTPYAGGARLSFTSGAGLNMTNACVPVPVIGTVVLGARVPGPLPVLATASYLHDNALTVGSQVDVTVDGITLSTVIRAAVTNFPDLPFDTKDALVADLGSLGADVEAQGGQLPPVSLWLTHTADHNAPPVLPAGTTVSTAEQVAASLLADPLERVPERVITLGAPILVGLALLGLLVSLLAAARGAASRDVVLAALGTTRPQRAALACALYTAVVVPAVLLGALLGLVLCRMLIPSFVLAADGSAPTPSALVLLAEPWTVLAALVVLVAAVATALIASLRRGDPLALARTGG
jgi:hypothetical protein